MREHVDEARFYPIDDDSVTEADIVAFFKGETGVPPVRLRGTRSALRRSRRAGR